jgi:two-component system response regulator YesN
MRFQRFYIKLILFSLFLSFCPVIALGLFSYIKLSTSVQDKVEKANQQILLQNQMRVEQVLKSIDRSVSQFSNSRIITESLEQNITFREFDVFFQIYRELKNMQTIDLPIQDIALVNFYKGWMINNNGLHTLTPDEIQSYRDIRQLTSWSINNNGNGPRENGIKFLKKLPTDFAASYEFIIVKIASSDLNQLITGSQDLGQQFIVDEHSQVLASSSGIRLGTDLSKSAMLEQIPLANSSNSDSYGFVSLASNNPKDIVTVRKSDYNNWTYLSTTPLDTIRRDSRTVGWVTLITCTAIFLFNIAAATFISRRMYTPILLLYQSSIGSGKGDHKKLSGSKDELQIINDHLQSLQLNERELLQRNRQQLPLLKHSFMLSLYEGKMKHEEIHHKLSLYGFSGPWQQMCVLSIEIDSLESSRYTKKDLDLLLFAIQNMISELVPSSKLLFAMVMHHSNVVLFGGDHTTEAQFKQEIQVISQLIQHHVLQYLNLQISVGISRIINDLSDSAYAYHSSVEALKYRFRLDPGAIIFIEDVRPEVQPALFFPEKLIHELIDAIKLADLDKANDILVTCIHSIADKHNGYKHYQILLAGLLNELLKEALQTGQYFAALHDDKDSVYEQLFQLTTVRETEQWFSQMMVTPLIQAMKTRKRLEHQKLSDVMIEMIHEDYNKDISLESCASRMNYHPNYLKRVFRLETGSSFSDYLSTFRLGKAKAYLRDTDMTISEIAEALRYSNLQNFSRYFRKTEGISPTEYRELARKKFPED